MNLKGKGFSSHCSSPPPQDLALTGVGGLQYRMKPFDLCNFGTPVIPFSPSKWHQDFDSEIPGQMQDEPVPSYFNTLNLKATLNHGALNQSIIIYTTPRHR